MKRLCATRAHGRWGDDRGSVLLLGLGLAVIVFALIAALADIAVLRLARNELNAQADAAALAGAQAIDVDALVTAGYLERGPAELVPLEPGAAMAAVRTHVAAMRRPEVVVVALSASRDTVSVTLAVPVHPPFTAAITQLMGGNGVVMVQASAAAQTRVG